MANDAHPNSDPAPSPGERFTFTLDEPHFDKDELLPLSEDEDRVPDTRESFLSADEGPIPAGSRSLSKSLSSAQMHPGRSSGAMESSSSPLQDEIDSMRRALKRLLESFSKVESIEEQYKLSSAINLTTASLFRLVRTQGYFLANRNTEMNRTIDDVLTEILKEWGRI